jgi:hypothetical protein
MSVRVVSTYHQTSLVFEKPIHLRSGEDVLNNGQASLTEGRFCATVPGVDKWRVGGRFWKDR